MKQLLPVATSREDAKLAFDLAHRWAEGDEQLRNLYPAANYHAAVARIRHGIAQSNAKAKRFSNDKYLVTVREQSAEGKPTLVHLSIKRLDQQPIHDWRDLQAIKNQLVGEECEGVELYPAQTRLVDAANQFHLWVVKDPTFRFPIGFDKGIVSDIPVGYSVNRPIKETV